MSSSADIGTFVKKIAAKDYNHSSSSAQSKGDALVEDASNRNALGDGGLALQGVQACSGDKAYKRVLTLLVSATVEEARMMDNSANNLNALAVAMATLVVQHDVSEDADKSVDMLRQSTKYLSKALKGGVKEGGNSSFDVATHISEAMLDAARSQESLLGPALVLAGTAREAVPEDKSGKAKTHSQDESPVQAVRKDQVNLLGRRIFNVASADDVYRAAPLIASLSQPEFNRSVCGILQFQLQQKRSNPEAMSKLVWNWTALLDILVQASKGNYVDAHLPNWVNVAVSQVDTEEGVALCRILALASPVTGTKALCEKLKDSEGAVKASEEIAKGLGELSEEKKQEDEWAKIGTDLAIPNINASQASTPTKESACTAWKALGAQGSVAPVAAAAAVGASAAAATASADALAKARARGGATAPASTPGVQAVTGLDDRIAAKQGPGATAERNDTARASRESHKASGAGASSARSDNARAAMEGRKTSGPGASTARNDDSRAAREGRKASGPGTAAAATQLNQTEADIMAKARARNQTQDGDVSKLDERIRDKVQAEPTANDDNFKDDDLGDKKIQILKEGDKQESFQDEPKNGRITSGSGPTVEVSQGVAGDGGYDYGQLPGHGGIPDVEYGGDDGLAVAVAVSPDEEDSFIPAAIEYDPDSKPPLYKNRRFRLYGVAALLLLIIIAVGISVVVSKNVSEKTADEVDQILVVTQAPTAPPTPAPTTPRQALGIKQEIAKITPIEKLEDPSTPHYRALKWIEEEDPMSLTADAENLFQRYSLVLMHLSTQKNGTWFFCGPDDETHDDPELCTGRKKIAVEPDEFEYLEDEYKWLSSESECFWMGVYCDVDGTVNVIEIVGNNLMGPIPDEIQSLAYMVAFRMYWNAITGSLPSWLGSMKHLGDIELHYNLLTGSIPEDIWDVEDIERINLGGNAMTGTISDRIGELQKLKGIFIMDNKFDGTIPSQIGNLESLAFTRWYNNEMEGTMPTEIGHLTKIREFWMFNMGLTGTIPTEIGLMMDLDFARLEANRFNKKIPEEIYLPDKMTGLYLHNNELTGTISTAVGNLVDLAEYTVKINLLTGPIPAELSGLRKLSLLWIYMNDLTGPVPMDICDLTFLRLSNFQADCLREGGIGPIRNECPCCQRCCDSAPGGICDDQDV